ncbi:MAG: family 43 glycosylhydrolase, partial [Acidimicrobiales bacterium]|nr:family 43 glycosylhydrolase [Acidimicrobiales bacterium]
MEATILVVIALVMVGSAALLFGSRGAEGAVVSQPLPTSSPGSPGITIASASEDLTGAWMTVQGHQYVMFVSTAFGDNRLNVPLFVGQPGHWAAEVDALPTMPPWALDVGHQGLTWEPMVSQFGTRFVLYFAASVRKDSRIHCLGTAVSDSITGPYTPTPRPIVCQSNSGGDIDPQVVTDGGHPFLIWKMDANSVPPYTAPSRIFSQPLSSDGLSVVGSPTVIYGTESAPPWARPIIEAPQMVASPFGGWWLFYSGGGGFFAP